MPRNRPGRLASAGRVRCRLFSLPPALILAAAALLSSCGLETVTIYDSPGFSDVTGILTLTHDTSNDSESSFLGYEIYYRAYDSTDKANTDRTAIEAAIDLDSATPDSCMSKLESLNYRRMTNASGSDERPRFRRTIFSSDSLYIYYGPLGWDIENVDVVGDDIRRWTKDSFNSAYVSGDEDYAGTDDLTNENTVYFVFFAVAYGVDFATSFNEILSYPKGTGNVISVTLNY